MPDEVREKILENAQAPRRVVADGVEVEEHPLADQIAADRHLDSKTAADASGSRGLRFTKLKPPGA